jgi:hypothetical protein
MGSSVDRQNEWSRNSEVTGPIFPCPGEVQQASLRDHLAQHGNS